MDWLRGKGPGKRGPGKENPYLALRQMALELNPAKSPASGFPKDVQLLAGLMEMGMDNGVASLVVIADGTTSLYFSTGGGIIGAGFHEPVKQPSKVFLATLNSHLAQMRPDPTGESPADGMIHLRAVTRDSGRLVFTAAHDDFAQKRNPLWDVFYAGHALIAEMRALPAVKDK